jgi:hypothetical protein
MVGITLGETGRLNVVVPGTPTLGSTAPPACRVVFGFLNAEGQIVKQEVKAILPGHAASLELTGVEAFLPPGPIRSLRADIRPVAELAAMQPSTVSCQMVSTFEVFDNATGRTSLLSQQPPVNDQPAAGN